MLAELMLPEALGSLWSDVSVMTPLTFHIGTYSAVRCPVCVHVIKQVLSTKALQDLGDVGVFAGRIAVLLVGSVAVVRPETVDRPAVVRASGRVGVPELRLQDQATWRLETACVVLHCGVLARVWQARRTVEGVIAGWGRSTCARRGRAS